MAPCVVQVFLLFSLIQSTTAGFCNKVFGQNVVCYCGEAEDIEIIRRVKHIEIRGESCDCRIRLLNQKDVLLVHYHESSSCSWNCSLVLCVPIHNETTTQTDIDTTIGSTEETTTTQVHIDTTIGSTEETTTTQVHIDTTIGSTEATTTTQVHIDTTIGSTEETTTTQVHIDTTIGSTEETTVTTPAGYKIENKEHTGLIIWATASTILLIMGVAFGVYYMKFKRPVQINESTPLLDFPFRTPLPPPHSPSPGSPSPIVTTLPQQITDPTPSIEEDSPIAHRTRQRRKLSIITIENPVYESPV
ncbi:mucin-2-like [Mytilus californianus]|uniref:mucin-2-like n=1 Tax=Mytilus californianus TaxID=6549 RepID=UPI002245018E|nr:mucin-2-like [Mytilus californianus]